MRSETPIELENKNMLKIDHQRGPEGRTQSKQIPIDSLDTNNLIN